MRRSGASCLAALLLIGACSGGSEPTTTTSLPPVTSTTIDLLPLTSTQAAREIGVVFQSAQFLITVGDAVYDSSDGNLYLGLRFHNLSDSVVSTTEAGRVELGGDTYHVSLTPISQVPPGVEVDLTGVARVGANPFDRGHLLWGLDGKNQTSISLADGSSTGFGPPVDFPVEVWAMVGRYTVHFAAGRVYADGVRGFEIPSGQRMMRLEFDEYTSAAAPIGGFHGSDHFDLVWPDGTMVEAVGGTPGRQGMAWTTSTGNSVDFPVPADPAGEYQLVFRGAGRHAIGVVRPELVQRLTVPLAIPDMSRTGPERYQGSWPPRPYLPSDPGPAVDVELTTDAVNFPGFTFRATRLSWRPDTRTAMVHGIVRRVSEEPDPDGLFSAPAHFAPGVGLAYEGRLYPGSLEGLVEVAPGEEITVSFRFVLVYRIDPRAATLFLTVGGIYPATLPLGPDSAHPLQPVSPKLLPLTGPTVAVGNYQVTMIGYRFGLPGRLDQPPVGKRALELTFDVTARQVENPGAFGLQFDPGSQLFLTAEDGYLQQPDNSEQSYMEDGETVRLTATYYVRADWQPGPIVMTVRSISMQAFGDRWLEATFTVAPAEGSPSA